MCAWIQFVAVERFKCLWWNGSGSGRFLVSNLFLPLGSLVYLLFCTSKYGWGWNNYTKEANTGKGLKIQNWMRGYITYILPLIILFIFGFGIYDKFFIK